MQPQKLDHVAIYAADREGLADLLCDELDVHVVDRTEKYILLGPTATDGKLTIFAAPEGEELGDDRLVSIMLAEEEGSERAPLVTPHGVTFTFTGRSDVPRHSVVGLTLRVEDPTPCAAQYVSQFGFDHGSAHANVATVSVNSGTVTLVKERHTPAERPMLFHLGLLVGSAQEHIDEAEEHGINVVNVVDAPNTYAVFVDGPCGVCLEYVEHKPEFALA
jgi:hypothetical protein